MLRQASQLAAPSVVQPQRVHVLYNRPRPRCQRNIQYCRSTSLTAEPVTAQPIVAHTALPAPEAARFKDDGTAFVEEFRVRGNEAGPDQRANIITIANLLQEVGGNHGVAMWGRASSGFAAMPGMDHLIFVASRMQIRMESYPSWGDIVRLETYFQEDGRLTSRRDWRLTDAVTGQYLGAATSTWVTINSETRKLAKIPEDVKQRFRRLAPNPPRHVLSEKETRKKLPDFVWPPQLTAPSQLGRRSDMDPNGHINNVAYLAWALEVIPEHIYQDYLLTEVEMDFKAECTAGDQIECYGMPLTDCANGNGSTQQFLHLLRKGGTNIEVWRARTTWTPRTAAKSAAVATSSSTAYTSNSNGRTPPPCAKVNQIGSKVAGSHLNGSSAGSLNGSSKSSASCSRTECSNTSCSNNQADTAAADPPAAPVATATSEETQVDHKQSAEQSKLETTGKGARKGWFGLW